MVTSHSLEHGYLDTTKSDGVGQIATLDAFLLRHRASVSATRAYLDNRTHEFHIRTYFHCDRQQMEQIRKCYRDELSGFSVHLEHIERPMPKAPHVISLLTTDRIGIETVLTRFLSELGLSIYWFEASAFSFPMTGSSHYVIASWIDLPKLYNKDELSEALKNLAADHNWENIELFTEEEYQNHSVTHVSHRMNMRMHYMEN